MRKVAGRLRLDLAQYRELEAFAAFASDLDRASRAQLDRGVRLVELLKQPNYSPYPVEEQTVSVWAGTEGKLDDVPVGDVRRFEAEFLQYLRHSHKATLDADRRRHWNDDIVAALDGAIAHVQGDVPRHRRRACMSTTLRPRPWRGRGERETVKRVVAPAEEEVAMAGQVRVLRRRIRTTRSTKKITKAMELVATSRIAKAQERVAASLPYAAAITGVLTALATNAEHRPPAAGAAGRAPGRRAGLTATGACAAATTPTPSGRPSS